MDGPECAPCVVGGEAVPRGSPHGAASQRVVARLHPKAAVLKYAGTTNPRDDGSIRVVVRRCDRASSSLFLMLMIK